MWHKGIGLLMKELETRELIRMWIEAENRRQLSYFTSLNPTGGHYTAEQKDYAINKAISIGVRAISRLLNVPRRPFKDG